MLEGYLSGYEEKALEDGFSEDFRSDIESFPGESSTSSHSRSPSTMNSILEHKPKWAGLTTRMSASYKYIMFMAGLLVLALLAFNVYTSHWSTSPKPEYIPRISTDLASGLNITNELFVKPEGFRIIAIVFYGRPKFVNILDCYLKKNLVSRGGFLDEVIFADNTSNQDDEDWLDSLVAEEPLYSKVVMSHRGGWFHDVWNNLATDPNTLYFKIDDDVLYVDDAAIPSLTKTILAHPEALDVGANIVNSPVTDWLHYHTGAVLPYLPDEDELTETTTSWRASELPHYAGSHRGDWQFPEKPDDQQSFEVGDEGGPPHKNHRWLPLRDSAANLRITPIVSSEYDPFGKGWYEWTIAAQQHYSFLARLERKELDMYWFGNKEGVWNTQFGRYNLNFVAIWGKSVDLMTVSSDDEDSLTVEIPKALKRPFLVDSHAIISHYSFGATPELETTDLLERYRLYANEMVCEADNQRLPADKLYKSQTDDHPLVIKDENENAGEDDGLSSQEMDDPVER